MGACCHREEAVISRRLLSPGSAGPAAERAPSPCVLGGSSVPASARPPTLGRKGRGRRADAALVGRLRGPEQNLSPRFPSPSPALSLLPFLHHLPFSSSPISLTHLPLPHFPYSSSSLQFFFSFSFLVSLLLFHFSSSRLFPLSHLFTPPFPASFPFHPDSPYSSPPPHFSYPSPSPPPPLPLPCPAGFRRSLAPRAPADPDRSPCCTCRRAALKARPFTRAPWPRGLQIYAVIVCILVRASASGSVLQVLCIPQLCPAASRVPCLHCDVFPLNDFLVVFSHFFTPWPPDSFPK